MPAKNRQRNGHATDLANNLLEFAKPRYRAADLISTTTKNTIGRLLRSSAAQILVWLLAADLFLTVVIPQHDLNWYHRAISGSHEPFCHKLFEYLCSSSNPDILVVGSSLVTVPALSCDQVYLEGKMPFPWLPDMFLFSSYERADYLARLVSAKLGRPNLQAVNLGLAGAVASDYFLVLQKAVECGKTPSLLICTIAPAEFLWMDGRGTENTRIKQCFHTYWWPFSRAEILLRFDAMRRAIAWHFDLLEQELGYCRKNVFGYLSEKTGHPADMFTATKKQLAESNHGQAHAPPVQTVQPAKTIAHVRATPEKASSTPSVSAVAPQTTPDASNMATAPLHNPIGADGKYIRKNTLEDLARYRTFYGNIGPLFDAHVRSFVKMLALAESHHIPMVVVNMPLTQENKDTLNAATYQAYQRTIVEITRAHGIQLINADQPGRYQLSDFYDSTHLNEVGGRKFFVQLVRELGDQQLAGVRSAQQQVY